MSLSNAPSIPGAGHGETTFAPPPLPPWEPGPPVPVPDDFQPPIHKEVICDFSPFLSAVAIVNRSLSNEYQGQIPLLTIPSTRIPSPLAGYISPEKIRDLKEYLCGHTPLPEVKAIAPRYGLPASNGVSIVSEPKNQFANLDSCRSSSTPRTNGPEIWTSWKRAYDLWHGNYIEGRINKAWLGSEYKRIEDWINEQDRTASKGINWNGGNANSANKSKEPPRWIRILEEDGEDKGEYMSNPEWEKQQATDALKKQGESILANGGGFFPMKSLKEFGAFEDAQARGDQFAHAWVDGVQNTLWRPKRFGEDENKPIIDIDADVGDSFNKQIIGGVPDATGFNGWIDGGVDCGRSPFPLLRSKTTYECHPLEKDIHRYAKHVSWDGVTGTVFNMPMSALNSTDPYADHPEDMRLLTNAVAYGDYFRDPQAESYGWSHKGTFPLDIRRVVKKENQNRSTEATSTFEVVELDDDFTLPERRKMKQNDPWWVTEDQRLKRDVPTRLQPPSSLKYNREVLTKREARQVRAILPVDDKAWEDEKTKDASCEAQYFLTNLHGGTLIVNGLEVRKGFVAGPLPSFAVIENAHGQVSFWWGVEGRDFGVSEGNTQEDQAQWDHLRGLPGWEYVGMSAGDVWRLKIGDRREREKTGDDLEDDGFWKECRQEWQRGEVILNPEPKITGIPPVWDGTFGNPAPSFASPQDEFKYLVMKTEAKRKQNAIESSSRGLHFPEGDSSWSGKLPVIKPAAETAADQAIAFWEVHHRTLQTSQTSFAKEFAKNLDLRDLEEIERGNRIDAEATAAAISKKRKSGSEFALPEPKKIMLHTGQPPHVEEELSIATLDYVNDLEDREAQVKIRLKGISPQDDDRIRKEYLAARDEADYAAHVQQIKANNDRAARGKPLVVLSPRWNFPQTVVEKHFKDVSAWKHALLNAARPARAQTPEERRAIIEKQKLSNKALEEEAKQSKAKREMNEAIVKRKRDFEKKQILGLGAAARARKAAENKKRDEIEKANFDRAMTGGEWDGTVGGQTLGGWNAQGYIPKPTKPLGQKLGHTPAGGNLSTGGQLPTGRSGGAPVGGFVAQPPYNPELPDDDTAMQWAIAESLARDRATQTAAAQKKADLEKSRTSHPLFAERERILINRAFSAGITVLEFAKREGHTNVKAYLTSETEKAIQELMTTDMSPADRFVTENRMAYIDALNEAFISNRDLNGVRTIDALRAQHWDGTLQEYLNHMAKTEVTLKDFPNEPVPALEARLSRRASEQERQAYNARGLQIRADQERAKKINEGKWRALQDKIRRAADFESRISALEQGKATTEVIHETWGGQTRTGLVF